MEMHIVPRLQGGVKDGNNIWLFFNHKSFAYGDMLCQDYRMGTQFYVREEPTQIEMPLVGKTYWAYKCSIIAQSMEDMESGDFMIGKIMRVLSRSVGEFDAPICGPGPEIEPMNS